MLTASVQFSIVNMNNAIFCLEPECVVFEYSAFICVRTGTFSLMLWLEIVTVFKVHEHKSTISKRIFTSNHSYADHFRQNSFISSPTTNTPKTTDHSHKRTPTMCGHKHATCSRIHEPYDSKYVRLCTTILYSVPYIMPTILQPGSQMAQRSPFLTAYFRIRCTHTQWTPKWEAFAPLSSSSLMFSGLFCNVAGPRFTHPKVCVCG